MMADDDEDGDVGEVVVVGNDEDEDMRVKGGVGGFSVTWVRRTVQLKGLEVLKGLESQATVKTYYTNLSCSLRYPFWFSEINLESDLLVEGYDDEDGDVGEVVGVGNDEDMRVKGSVGGFSGVRRTVQLKGLEVLKGLESQATVKTNYANLSCSLRYPFWFSEINLESDLLVEGSGTEELKGLELLKGLESQATVQTNYANLSCSLRYPFWFSEINLESDLLVDVLLVEGSGTQELKGLEVLKGLESQATVQTNYGNLSCSLRYSFWFSEINLESDLLVEVVIVKGKSGMEILLGCVGSGTEVLKGLEWQATAKN